MDQIQLAGYRNLQFQPARRLLHLRGYRLDLSVAQGFLAQFDDLDAAYTFYSSDPQWQVMATGLGSAAPYTGAAADLALLTDKIAMPAAGVKLSNGCRGLTNGRNGWGGVRMWQQRRALGLVEGRAAQLPPLGQYDEWLVFRIGVAATPTTNSVPEPGTAALLPRTAVAGAFRHRARRVSDLSVNCRATDRMIGVMLAIAAASWDGAGQER